MQSAYSNTSGYKLDLDSENIAQGMSSQESMLFQEAIEEVKRQQIKRPKSRDLNGKKIVQNAESLYGPLQKNKNQIKFYKRAQTPVENTRRQ